MFLGTLNGNVADVRVSGGEESTFDTRHRGETPKASQTRDVGQVFPVRLELTSEGRRVPSRVRLPVVGGCGCGWKRSNS